MNKKNFLLFLPILICFQIKAADNEEKGLYHKKAPTKIDIPQKWLTGTYSPLITSQSTKSKIKKTINEFLLKEQKLQPNKFKTINDVENELRKINNGNLGGIPYTVLDLIVETIKTIILENKEYAAKSISDAFKEIKFVKNSEEYIFEKLQKISSTNSQEPS